MHRSNCKWKLRTVSQLEQPLICQTPRLYQDTLSRYMEIEAKAFPEKLIGSRLHPTFSAFPASDFAFLGVGCHDASRRKRD